MKKIEARNIYKKFQNLEVLKGIDLEVNEGEVIAVIGPSGGGKSTLLRAVAGIWPYVQGKIVLPEQEKLMFIPQKPYLPLGSLREALLYPGNKPVSDEVLVALMEQCQIGYLKDKLDIVADWSHVLSVGEQQRLAYVRAHIQEPVWLFLDEATSALDEETEAKMYSLIGERLANTTIVSIGHRSTLNKYHQLVLELDKNNKSVTLKTLE